MDVIKKWKGSIIESVKCILVTIKRQQLYKYKFMGLFITFFQTFKYVFEERNVRTVGFLVEDINFPWNSKD